MASDDQSCLCHEASAETLEKDAFGRTSGLVHKWSPGRAVCPERAWKLCGPPPDPHPMHAFHLAVPELYVFIINKQTKKWSSHQSNASLSSVNHSSKLTEPKEGVMGTSEL